MDLERRVSRLEGKGGDPWRREDLFAHISDGERREIYERVRRTVSPEEAAWLDKLFEEDQRRRA